MRFDILTLFPEMFRGMLESSIISRAINNGIVQVNLVNIRDFSLDKHRKVDDYPFGGGTGMIMSCEPISRAIASVRTQSSRVVYMSPKGRVYNQRIAEEYAALSHVIILCGHYEGVDQRVIDMEVDDEISLGDFVLTGGEIAAMALVDSVSRLIPGVLPEGAVKEESFNGGLLEYPQYTRPAVYKGVEVPPVLLSGNHEMIRRWRRKKAFEITMLRRPDLLADAKLSQEDLQIIFELECENIRYSNRKEGK
nr:tRNA (guanosine(37)-N1)-methyltransferase TrmD [Caldanaerobius polysaccharolyticus]